MSFKDRQFKKRFVINVYLLINILYFYCNFVISYKIILVTIIYGTSIGLWGNVYYYYNINKSDKEVIKVVQKLHLFI